MQHAHAHMYTYMYLSFVWSCCLHDLHWTNLCALTSCTYLLILTLACIKLVVHALNSCTLATCFGSSSKGAWRTWTSCIICIEQNTIYHSHIHYVQPYIVRYTGSRRRTSLHTSCGVLSCGQCDDAWCVARNRATLLVDGVWTHACTTICTRLRISCA